MGIDYLIARATGTDFNLVGSLKVNAALNVTTLGVGSTVAKLRHLGKVAALASHADEVADAARVVAEAASHADEAADALRAAERIEEAAGVLRGVENATEATRDASRLPRRFSRYMSRSELETVQETGLLRGGRPGETYFTTNRCRTVRSAEEKLALPRAPEVRLDFEIVNQPRIYEPRKVAPAFGKPGGGIDYWSPDPVRVRIIRWCDLR